MRQKERERLVDAAAGDRVISRWEVLVTSSTTGKTARDLNMIVDNMAKEIAIT
jgi:hypothetical protein